MKNPRLFLIVPVFTVFLSGCIVVPKSAGIGDVQKNISSRGPMTIEKFEGPPPESIQKEIQALSQNELTAEKAVQIALFNSRALQVLFQDLAIAQADYVQASLLENPSFSGRLRFPVSPGQIINTEFSVVQNVLDALMLPLRKSLAKEQFQQTKLRVSDGIVKLAAKVKDAYYHALAAQAIFDLRQSVLEASEAASELAERQLKAGTMNAIDAANQKAAYQQAKVNAAQSQIKLIEARENLIRLMGLSSSDVTWVFPSEFPALPQTEISTENLEDYALKYRFDLAAARQQIKILKKVQTVTRLSIVPAIHLGVETEKGPDDTNVVGPSWEVAVPIFDQHQAANARAKAQLVQSEHQYAALEVDARSEVRKSRDQMLASRKMAEIYQESIIPIQESVVELSQKQYNYMLMGAYQLLMAKRNEIDSRQELIRKLRDYWKARTDLEKAVGGKLPDAQEINESMIEGVKSK